MKRIVGATIFVMSLFIGTLFASEESVPFVTRRHSQERTLGEEASRRLKVEKDEEAARIVREVEAERQRAEEAIAEKFKQFMNDLVQVMQGFRSNPGRIADFINNADIATFTEFMNFMMRQVSDWHTSEPYYHDFRTIRFALINSNILDSIKDPRKALLVIQAIETKAQVPMHWAYVPDLIIPDNLRKKIIAKRAEIAKELKAPEAEKISKEEEAIAEKFKQFMNDLVQVMNGFRRNPGRIADFINNADIVTFTEFMNFLMRQVSDLHTIAPYYHDFRTIQVALINSNILDSIKDPRKALLVIKAIETKARVPMDWAYVPDLVIPDDLRKKIIAKRAEIEKELKVPKAEKISKEEEAKKLASGAKELKEQEPKKKSKEEDAKEKEAKRLEAQRRIVNQVRETVFSAVKAHTAEESNKDYGEAAIFLDTVPLETFNDFIDSTIAIQFIERRSDAGRLEAQSLVSIISGLEDVIRHMTDYSRAARLVEGLIELRNKYPKMPFKSIDRNFPIREETLLKLKDDIQKHLPKQSWTDWATSWIWG